MDLQGRSTKMLLLTMPKRGFVATFSVVVAAFVLCIVIGATGPQVFDRREVSSYRCPPGVTVFDPQQGCEGVDLAQPGTHWTGEIQHLDKLNQELLLFASLTNKDTDRIGVEKEVTFHVQISGRDSVESEWESVLEGQLSQRKVVCKEGKQLCNNLTIAHEPFIRHSFYRFNVSIVESGDFLGDVFFTFFFVNHTYTLFELWFRFTFLILSFLVVIVYSHRLRNFTWSDWTLEQKWVAALLFALMAYNNPFYPLEILVNNWFPIFLNRFLYGTFLVVLFLFWLVMFDGIRKEANERTFLRFYLPKFIIVGLFWIISVVLFTWEELHILSDPTYSSPAQLPGYIVIELILLAIMVFYVFWVVVAVFRTCGDQKALPYLGLRLKFFGSFTLVVLLIVVGGIIFGAIGRTNNAAEFLSFLALFNLYCFTLALVYLPARTTITASSRSDRIGMVRLEEDDEVDLPSGPMEDDAPADVDSIELGEVKN